MGKRQHYVPVFYLKGFLEGNEDFLWVYEKGKPARESSPEAIGFENYFYAFTDANGERDAEAVEDALTVMEGAAFEVLEKIKRFENLGEKDRQPFARFIALMIARVPKFRGHLEKLAIEVVRHRQVETASDPERFAEHIAEFQKETGTEINKPTEELRQQILYLESYYKISVENKDFSLQGLSMAQEAEEIILKMNWHFVRAAGKGKFLTSDNPVFKNGQRIDDKEGSVRFPVSREIFLIGHWKKLKRDWGQIEIVRDLKEFNWMTVAAAKRYVFASENSSEIQKWVDNDIGAIVQPVDGNVKEFEFPDFD